MEETLNLTVTKSESDSLNEMPRVAAVTADLDLCAEYRKVRPFIQTALKVVRKIPVYGDKIAGFIELLVGIADIYCNV